MMSGTRLRAANPLPPKGSDLVKDQFEKTSEYQARVAAADAARSGVENRYRLDLTTLSTPYNAGIDDLLSRRYHDEAVTATLTSYDADKELLCR